MKRAWDSRFTGEAFRDYGKFHREPPSEGKLGKIFYALKFNLEIYSSSDKNYNVGIILTPMKRGRIEPQYNNAHIFTLDHTLLYIGWIHIKKKIPFSTFSFIFCCQAMYLSWSYENIKKGRKIGKWRKVFGLETDRLMFSFSISPLFVALRAYHI